MPSSSWVLILTPGLVYRILATFGFLWCMNFGGPSVQYLSGPVPGLNITLGAHRLGLLVCSCHDTNSSLWLVTIAVCRWSCSWLVLLSSLPLSVFCFFRTKSSTPRKVIFSFHFWSIPPTIYSSVHASRPSWHSNWHFSLVSNVTTVNNASCIGWNGLLFRWNCVALLCFNFWIWIGWTSFPAHTFVSTDTFYLSITFPGINIVVSVVPRSFYIDSYFFVGVAKQMFCIGPSLVFLQ